MVSIPSAITAYKQLKKAMGIQRGIPGFAGTTGSCILGPLSDIVLEMRPCEMEGQFGRSPPHGAEATKGDGRISVVTNGGIRSVGVS